MPNQDFDREAATAALLAHLLAIASKFSTRFTAHGYTLEPDSGSSSPLKIASASKSRRGDSGGEAVGVTGKFFFRPVLKLQAISQPDFWTELTYFFLKR